MFLALNGGKFSSKKKLLQNIFIATQMTNSLPLLKSCSISSSLKIHSFYCANMGNSFNKTNSNVTGKLPDRKQNIRRRFNFKMFRSQFIHGKHITMDWIHKKLKLSVEIHNKVFKMSMRQSGKRTCDAFWKLHKDNIITTGIVSTIFDVLSGKVHFLCSQNCFVYGKVIAK